MKNAQIIALCIAVIMLCICSSVVTYHKISVQFDTINQKMAEVDHRRNAQYGIIKNKLEQCGVK